MTTAKPKVIVSRCLLGERVRYDARIISHKHIVEQIGSRVAWLPVCPEVGCGMPVPREPVQLVGDAVSARMISVHTRKDVSPQVEAWIARSLAELDPHHPVAAILKNGSPSCAICALELFDEAGVHTGQFGAGLFAQALMRRHKSLVLVGELDLDSDSRAKAFLDRLEGLPSNALQGV